ncbi:MAG: DUF1501 domain-containing protein [SAR202 cluster bacterium]|nr:DUF1501 domain-containing protein [SAR202 cluster bacterium]MQG35997.1 DUF1501 domain-containing protein [SAR202 cluster bacterium]MQG87065.1 DUF1501 domain-containing protein [SAR202 cluster bacterium]|tara:strand:+ start:32125 stop:33252 length:1128 start_codon:yes stop_codon:yes gene_type:complete
MTSTKKDPVIVVLQMSGGNDYLNTTIPYADGIYRDSRPVVGVPEDRIIKIDDQIGFHPEMAPIKELYDAGDMAIIHGVGYADSPRSHFRSMDIWHTCEPDKIGTEGWLGKVTRELDPNKENVLTAVSFGAALPRALALPGVPVACVDDLDNYGLLPGIANEQRNKILDRFARMYSPTIGTGAVMDYLGQTGLDTLEGADILKDAPKMYSSTVEYPDSTIAKKLKGIAQVHLANFGTRVFYCDHGSFDSHSNQVGMHDKLWKDVSEGIRAFFADLREHNASENVIMFLFSEFGRRVIDNGSGTDHGAGGVAFALGDQIRGGQYGEFPSMKPEHLEQGDVVPNVDFRGVYSTMVEEWFGLDANPIVNGNFEKLAYLK